MIIMIMIIIMLISYLMSNQISGSGNYHKMHIKSRFLYIYKKKTRSDSISPQFRHGSRICWDAPEIGFNFMAYF